VEFSELNISSRLFLGSAGYPSIETLEESVIASKSDFMTVSLRRQVGGNSESHNFSKVLDRLGIKVLPNTSGCYNAKDAVTVAKMARDVFETNFIKLEVVTDESSQAPNPLELVKAAEELNRIGFTVFPYTSDDLGLAYNLVDSGCDILMPGGSPIGSANGILNPFAIRKMVEHFPDKIIVLDAGVGLPSHASQAMELGCDAVLVNSAISKSIDPVKMSAAFYHAVEAGRLAYTSGPIKSSRNTVFSSPITGLPFSKSEFDILT
jgi:thiazole synthase